LPIGVDQTPPAPEEFCDTLTVLTPGVRLSNWVKFLPFSGRSFTSVLTIATPSSAVETCRASDFASTFTVCCTEPTESVTSKVAIWFTSSVMFVCREVANPLFAYYEVIVSWNDV